MGRKGVSKRKAKKNKTVSNNNTHQSGNSPVQALVKDKGAPLNTSTPPLPTGHSNKNKKGK
ncbi:MAG: hypothetical protein HYZ25_16345 [Chloroflexi bacterium]|nr:hypothetical protein [Chloroflexota bacterium]